MNAPVAPAQVAPSLKLGQVAVHGRIVAVRKAGASFLHLITMPSSDPYESPQTIEVIAKSRLGDIESTYKGVCRLGGYRRSYNSTDQQTGEIRKVGTADNKLFAIEE